MAAPGRMGLVEARAPRLDDDDKWAPPREFAEYRLVQRLGSGAMGVVWLAHDRLLDRSVAIKFITQLADDGRERFLVEARAAARIHHPNVVDIHRVGELDDRPYLVAEYIRGTCLADLPLPQPPARAVEIGVGLARGLAAAHRQGVLHRDIKLANAMLDEHGEVKLLDFSLAKLVDVVQPPTREPLPFTPPHREPLSLDRTLIAAPGTRGSHDITDFGTLVGTPNYMAPELWRAEPASRRSDVYALGVLLYWLAGGRPPTESQSLIDLATRVQERDPLPLRERVADLDPRFAALVDRCLARDPAARPASGEELRAALEELLPGARDGRVPAGNPYRGLRAFEAEHRDLFFGRIREVLAVVDRLRAAPFVLVAGDSGVGKSSLCRAGVLPALKDGLVEPHRRWTATTLTPGRRPVAALLAALADSLELPEDDLAAEVAADPDALERALRRQQGSDRGRILFIDQLEELVTLASPAEAAEAARLLARLAVGVPGVRLLATVRGDFLTRVAALPDLGEELARGLYFLTPMTPAGVRTAIVGPAQAKGVTFESEALVEQLVAAGVEGSLPLLQFALAELWEARDPTSATITAAALDKLGGVSGALARHADSVLARLDLAKRRAARSLLLRLVTVDDTRAILGEDDVAADEAERAALAALIAARLIVVRETPDGITHEIAHEALIRGWLTLQVWLDEERESRLIRHRLEAAAADWERLGRRRDALWQAHQLAELTALTGPLRPREAAFVAASRARARQRRRLRIGAAITVPLIALLALTGARWARYAAFRDEVDRHLAAAATTVAAAHRADADAQHARAAALARFDARDPAAEVEWRRALALAPVAADRFADATQSLETALSLDAARPDVRDALADLLYDRAVVAERDGDDVDPLLARMRLYDPDGRRAARWDAPARVDLASDPPGAAVTLARYTADPAGRLTLGADEPLGATPLVGLELPAGSHRLTFVRDGAAPVHVPLLVRRDESVALAPRLPLAAEIPPGFVFVPAGRFLYGSAGDDDLRRGFLAADPIHTVTTGDFLIARHETTYGEYIAFLDALPPEPRAVHLPKTDGAAFQQAPGLRRLPDGGWRLVLRQGDRTRELAPDDPLVYPSRARRGEHDWRLLPVTGITWRDAHAYTQWLRSTGALPGARLCSEREWEYAARGADGRLFPHGAQLLPDDANFDETHAREPAAMAADAVGGFPATTSPFGVDDLTGNVWEWTAPPDPNGEKVARGGAFFFGSLTARTTNRSGLSEDFRDGTLGMRVCADPPPR